jgi:hypothetical protein
MPDIFGSDVEPNDPEEIPAPDVDLSQPIYPSPESTEPRESLNVDEDDELLDDDDDDDYDDSVGGELSEFEQIKLRLENIEGDIAGLKEGVNTIGVMMNSVAEAFDTIMQKVNEGGIGALLGGFMGGKKNG